jgi:cyclophilin family peptidyl-prolyl cis-trans isomerase
MMNNDSGTSDSPTKESLDYFSERRKRWKIAPRNKVVVLKPISPALSPKNFNPIIDNPPANNVVAETKKEEIRDIPPAAFYNSGMNHSVSKNPFSSIKLTAGVPGTTTSTFAQKPTAPILGTTRSQSPFRSSSADPPKEKTQPAQQNPFNAKKFTMNTSSSSAVPKQATSIFGSFQTTSFGSLATTAAQIKHSPAESSLPKEPTKNTATIPASTEALSSKHPQDLSTTTDTGTSHRDRLLDFYKKYNPGKIDSVDETLASYRGKEDSLFLKLENKYVTGKDGVLPPSGDGPTCFLDFKFGEGANGRVVVKLYQDKVPIAAENFRCLCTGEKGKGLSGKELSYRFSKVHRVVPNFCVQLGDFTKGNGTGGGSIYQPNSAHGDMWGKFKDESFMQHSRKGLLSMANNGPDGNGSQFFFTLRALPHLNGKHVVFGEVLSGMDIVEKIGSLKTDSKQCPAESVVVDDCGEIKDGQETKAGASTNATTGGLESTVTTQFGASTLSSFGSSSTPSRVPSSTPFSFGAPSSMQSNGTAEPSSTSGFGTLPKPFSGFATTASSFSFGNGQ